VHLLVDLDLERAQGPEGGCRQGIEDLRRR
jgi:hypothetical protein